MTLVFVIDEEWNGIPWKFHEFNSMCSFPTPVMDCTLDKHSVV